MRLHRDGGKELCTLMETWLIWVGKILEKKRATHSQYSLQNPRTGKHGRLQCMKDTKGVDTTERLKEPEVQRWEPHHGARPRPIHLWGSPGTTPHLTAGLAGGHATSLGLAGDHASLGLAGDTPHLWGCAGGHATSVSCRPCSPKGPAESCGPAWHLLALPQRPFPPYGPVLADSLPRYLVCVSCRVPNCKITASKTQVPLHFHLCICDRRCKSAMACI